ncbi:MAG: MBOAT family O-acyltransferase [Emergencia sp.]
MVFSSTVFLFAFLPLTLGIYFLSPPILRNGVLLAASLLFYAWGEPVYILVMAGSVGLNYICGLAIGKFEGRHKLTKPMLAFAVFGNLVLLGWFKYADFITENLNRGFDLGIPAVHAVLPIGISFYTFQAMSYVIDVFRGKVQPQKSVVRFALYVTMFPQLIAGPVIRYASVEKQLGMRQTDLHGAAEGIRRFITGLGKKVLLANQAGLIWTEISGIPAENLPAATAWLGALAFTFQIYFDFSGYSDMAIGLGRIFGFTFDENFRYPYASGSITEFWRRWHISLGTWFREYVYIPLGGNRKGAARQIINIFIVWALTGLWHGASWNFLWWGVYFALLLIAEKLFLLKILEKLPALVRHVYAMFFVICGWVIFALEDGSSIASYFLAMVGEAGIADGRTVYLLETWGLLILVMAVGSTALPAGCCRRLKEHLKDHPVAEPVLSGSFCLLVLVFSTAFLVSDTYNPFLYFRF